MSSFGYISSFTLVEISFLMWREDHVVQLVKILLNKNYTFHDMRPFMNWSLFRIICYHYSSSFLLQFTLQLPWTTNSILMYHVLMPYAYTFSTCLPGKTRTHSSSSKALGPFLTPPKHSEVISCLTTITSVHSSIIAIVKYRIIMFDLMYKFYKSIRWLMISKCFAHNRYSVSTL